MLYSNKDLKKLILPLVLEQFLAILVGMVDTVMISGVGEAAVSGVSLVDNINILVINITAAMATGGAVVAGHFLGQKDSESAGKAAWQLILFSSAASVVIFLMLVAFHRPLLYAIFGNVEAEVMSSAVTYLLITAISIVPLAVYNSCAALFRAMNGAKTTLMISILMNAINVVGNAILIFGAGMGVAGAAIATTVSRTVAAIAIFGMMFQTDRQIHIKGRVDWHINVRLIKKILYIGIPNGVENSLFQLGKILLLSLISTFGTYAMAANAVCNTLAGFNILPGQAIGLALVSVAAVCIGAGDFEQARYYTKKLMLIAVISIAALSAVLIGFSPWIMKVYHLSPETEQLAIQVIRYHAVLAMLIWVPSFTLPNTLRAAGDVVWTMFIAIGSMWVFRIGASYVFHNNFHMGLLGVWVAMTIDWAFRSICYCLRYRGHKWEKFFR
ncbi:MAG: MATE family efflux transporter [Lachnospiraceae bacterium]|jgi:putative MATE family efflux protein|nr:MATE family efflux transporter [Lachnospiraceae bacterium]MCI9107915.1 MATE family efflux transporter [Lachnospiraceae bacterium]MCI9343827.1 MATE family efflux transporter [Lachnospiraceae bacterium]GFH91404.1 putative FMN/FAD exporter YeeO [Lachnospiraceae bacterium]